MKYSFSFDRRHSLRVHLLFSSMEQLFKWKLNYKKSLGVEDSPPPVPYFKYRKKKKEGFSGLGIMSLNT